MSLDEKLTPTALFWGGLMDLILKSKYHHYYIGEENLVDLENKKLIFTGNHYIAFDPFMVVWPVMKQYDRFIHILSKKENFQNFFYNYLFTQARAISLDRGHEWSDLKDKITSALDYQWIFIACEGTRKYSGFHGPYQSGTGYFYRSYSNDLNPLYIVPSFVTTEIFSKRPAAFVVYGAAFAPVNDNARRINRELYDVQGRLTVLTVDNVLSWYLINHSESGFNQWPAYLADKIVGIMENAKESGLIIDPRLISSDSIDYYRIFRRVKSIMHTPIPTTSFQAFMQLQGHDIDDVTYVTPDEIKHAARPFRQKSPFVYASNTVKHLNLSQFQ